MTTSETTTPADYEAACARYNAISGAYGRLDDLIKSFDRVLGEEYEAAHAALRQHEREPGVPKRFAGGVMLSFDELDRLEALAVKRLERIFPWSVCVALTGLTPENAEMGWALGHKRIPEDGHDVEPVTCKTRIIDEDGAPCGSLAQFVGNTADGGSAFVCEYGHKTFVYATSTSDVSTALAEHTQPALDAIERASLPQCDCQLDPVSDPFAGIPNASDEENRPL